MQIEQHADSDKEQPQQHIAEWLDVVFDLIAIFGFGDQHSRKKRSQRQREPCEFRHPRQAERHQQHGEHKKFGGFLARNHAEQRARHTLANGENKEQDQCRLGKCSAHFDHQRSPRERQCRHQYQQRHHCQILKQQDAHNLFAVGRMKLGLVR